MWRPSTALAARAAAQFETPLYLYDISVARRRIGALRAAAEGEIDVWYALKANANRALLEALRPGLDGADVASGGELVQALGAGFLGDQIGFTGPGKTEAELRAALEAGVRVSVESLDELDALARLAREAGRPARVMLRVNPAEKRHAFGVATGGVPGPFGVDESELEPAVARILGLKADFRFEGVHVHAGSGCTSAGAWHRHAVSVLDLAARVAELGAPVGCVNLGGGLASASDGLDVVALGRKLAGSARRFRAAFGAVQIVCEPGRFLVGDAGVFVTRVVRRVSSRGRTVVVLDGGINNFLFGTARFQDGPPPRVLNLSRPGSEVQRVAVVGPACTPLDTFGEQIEAEDPQPGDLLALGPAGAYGFSASPHLFLGHDAPAEVLVDEGELREARPRRSLGDFD